MNLTTQEETTFFNRDLKPSPMKYRLMYHLPRSSIMNSTISSKTLISQTPAGDIESQAEKIKHSRLDKLKRELEKEEKKVELRKASEKRIKEALKRSRERVSDQTEALKEANKKRIAEV
jgi:septal ring factor EnvC (AmiA/AmiB activator)